jgi:pimeloyl-ACP methyl ester carboxylesterase/DNA-binding CsgD family transcriptional regulator
MSVVDTKQRRAPTSPVPQRVRFCTAPDGTRLAYETIGSGPPLVRAAHWLTHLELDWQSIIWRPWLDELAKFSSFLRYDERGCGLSDRDHAHISFDAWVSDLEAVVDAAGLARFALLGISQGAAIAVDYAVRHPERVSKLVLYGGYARGRCKRGDPEQLEESDLRIRAMRLGWGRENPAFRHIFTNQFIGSPTTELLAAWDQLQRLSCSGETAARIATVTHNIDVMALLPQVKVPTLVMHSTNDIPIPFEEGRLIASLIPGAQFVPLESGGHVLHPAEPAFHRFFAETKAFIGGDAPEPKPIDGLTPRESQLLEQLARGKSNQEIATAAGISPKTVRNVVTVLFDKLGVHTRAEAIVKAREAGYGTAPLDT